MHKLAELVYINIKYIASNTSLMMSLSIGYPQILASGYPDSKFTIRFSPNSDGRPGPPFELCQSGSPTDGTALPFLFESLL